MRSSYPAAAAVPLVIASISMMLEGVYFAAYGGGLPGSAFIPSGSLIPPLQVSGYFAFLEGAVILFLSLVVLAWPGWHLLVGIGSITLGLLSLFSGGGFLAGAVLAYIGGIIAIYHTPRHAAPNEVDLAMEIIEDDPVIEADLLASET
jgi:hypothetical protein